MSTVVGDETRLNELRAHGCEGDADQTTLKGDALLPDEDEDVRALIPRVKNDGVKDEIANIRARVKQAQPQQAPHAAIYSPNSRMSVMWARIVQRGGLLKTGRKWTLSDSAKWNNSVSVLYNRECYDKLILDFTGKRNVLISGTTGIGKSMFLMAFLVHLAERHPTSEIPTINFKRWLHKGKVEELKLFADGHIEIYDSCRHSRPQYLISDNVDIHEAYGTVLNLLVACDNEPNYKVFSKRVVELGKLGLWLKMPVFTYDELLCIKPESLSLDEALFKFNIFGGSARYFIAFSESGAKDELVERAMLLFFGEEKRGKFLKEWDSALRLISCQLALARQRTKESNAVNDLMIHITVDSEGNDSVIWASPFLKFLACMVEENKRKNELMFLSLTKRRRQ